MMQLDLLVHLLLEWAKEKERTVHQGGELLLAREASLGYYTNFHKFKSKSKEQLGGE